MKFGKVQLKADVISNVNATLNKRKDGAQPLIKLIEANGQPIYVKLLPLHDNQVVDSNTTFVANEKFFAGDEADLSASHYIIANKIGVSHTNGRYYNSFFPNTFGLSKNGVCTLKEKYLSLCGRDMSLTKDLVNKYLEGDAAKAAHKAKYSGYSITEKLMTYFAAVQVAQVEINQPVSGTTKTRKVKAFIQIGEPTIYYVEGKVAGLLRNEFNRKTEETQTLCDENGTEWRDMLTSNDSSVQSPSLVVKLVHDANAPGYREDAKKKVVISIVPTALGVLAAGTNPDAKEVMKDLAPMNIIGYLEKGRKANQEMLDALHDAFNLTTDPESYAIQDKYNPEDMYFQSEEEVFDNDEAKPDLAEGEPTDDGYDDDLI